MNSKRNEQESESDRRNSWIHAARCLLISDKSKVECPECGDGILERVDQKGSSKKHPKFILRCPSCGESMELEL